MPGGGCQDLITALSGGKTLFFSLRIEIALFVNPGLFRRLLVSVSVESACLHPDSYFNTVRRPKSLHLSRVFLPALVVSRSAVPLSSTPHTKRDTTNPHIMKDGTAS